ncbi:MAG: TetR/AcrR family transcriptional regulator [Gemmatimonadales bacterium]
MVTLADTADRILDVAEQLIQTRGYTGFSYADISASVGITKASIHYHFPTKADLARSLAQRHRRAFAVRVSGLEQEAADPGELLERYVGLYQETLRSGDHMCLYGMLAAAAHTLPESVYAEVNGFFADQLEWLAGVLGRGRDAGRLEFTGSSAGQAKLLLAALEGAMLVSRSRRDVGYFTEVLGRLVAGLWARQGVAHAV